jgi:hypothetical protein
MTLVFDQSTVTDVETRDAYIFTYNWPKDEHSGKNWRCNDGRIPLLTDM